MGAHCLRHSLATEMLRAGASLPEVAGTSPPQSIRYACLCPPIDGNALGVLAWVLLPEGG